MNLLHQDIIRQQVSNKTTIKLLQFNILYHWPLKAPDSKTCTLWWGVARKAWYWICACIIQLIVAYFQNQDIYTIIFFPPNGSVMINKGGPKRKMAGRSLEYKWSFINIKPVIQSLRSKKRWITKPTLKKWHEESGTKSQKYTTIRWDRETQEHKGKTE